MSVSSTTSPLSAKIWSASRSCPLARADSATIGGDSASKISGLAERLISVVEGGSITSV